ncbi:unnamed protein product [Parascedosporium putredinis]|uniref:Uncharacterized protein n=1 Tax=Parascedosporium putredinis TaxID=1442378 RepID=A0A9P1H4D3_9PEZI|nr:unnamed protein product [Parascedosporium putredinis]CAI7996539.1 unnamed protein product [Parascedosporium putredinis]
MDLMEMWKLIYQEELPPDIGPVKDILEEYSGIDSTEVEAHLHTIIGFELFRDRHRTPAGFVVGNMMDDVDEGLEKIDGRISIVHASNFWHLFNWTQQLAMAVRLVRFFKMGEKRAMIYGRHVGTHKAGSQLKARHPSSMTKNISTVMGRRRRSHGHKVESRNGILGERLAQIPGFNGETMAARYGVYQIN